MQNKSSYILWLPSWYPSNVDHYNGDFTQRQAKSVAIFRKVIVIYVIQDNNLNERKTEVEQSMEGNLIEYRVYYSLKNNSPAILRVNKYYWLLFKLFIQIKKQYGLPKLVHLHVIGKIALLALVLKKIKSIPYLISEHWTGYYNIDAGGLHSKSYLMRKFYKIIFKNSALVIPVSNNLGKQIQQIYPGINYQVVPNVVDTSIFGNIISNEKNSIKRIVHVSTLGYQKNIEGIIGVIKKLAKQRNDFELVLVGPYSHELKKHIEDDQILTNKVKFTGNISYEDVSNIMKNSDFLIMFSRYENLPCVILEALCCGLPVITTNVGGIPEVINKDNGILVNSEDEKALLQSLEFMLDHLHQYDQKQIADNAKEKFNYKSVGMSINNIYKSYL